MGLSLKECYSKNLNSSDLDYFKKNECRELIKSNYSKIGKKAVFLVPGYDEEKIFAKDAHMVSVYYIGMLLKELVSNHLGNKFKQIVEDEIKNDREANLFYDGLYVFDYLWCLASLYHDVVAHYEWKNCFDGTKYEVKDDYRHIKECIHKQFDYDIESLLIESKGCFNFTHTSDVILKYFNYIFRKEVIDEETGKRKNKLEHGILAGNILYDVLSKNLKNKLGYEKHIVDDNDLVWDKNDNLLYMYAADAIIVHNMWYIKDTSDTSEYKDNGLGNLIYESKSKNDNRLNLNDNPLAFLLGLVDTIEPIKYFCVIAGSKKGEIDKEKIIPILEDIFIQVNLEKNSIVISSDKLDLAKWYSEKIEGMKSWLKLTTDYDKEHKNIVISI